MKKQVTFAEGQTVRRLHQEALPRSTGVNESEMDAGANSSRGLKIHRPPAARCEPQLQHVTTVQIPKTITAAPYLKHAALTPAQREYLCTIAASYSAAHVRNLITQHYMNVLRRCIRAGDNHERGDLVDPSVTVLDADESDKHQSERPSGAKHKGRINTRARNPGKSFPPKIPNRRARLSNSSGSKEGKKRTTTSPTVRRANPRRPISSYIKLLEEEEEEEEGLDDSLSEGLSSLSLGDWDGDTLSDLRHLY